MTEYVLLFRLDLTTPGAQPSQAELDGYMGGWMRWIEGIAAQGQLADGGNHFSVEGRVIRRNGVERTLYQANAESVAGYIVVSADSFDSAVEMAKACPILDGRAASVEVRATASPGTA